MQHHTRAMIAASAYVAISGKTIAGLYDHGAARHLQIAAESRGHRVQGADGDRSARFGGDLPELYDAQDQAFVSMEIAGQSARGYDRGSDSHYTVEVTDRLINLYDHSAATWFAFEAQFAHDSFAPQPG